MSRKTIAVKAKTLKQLIRSIDEGRFAIPKLQREFVWDGPKAAKLFDSLLCHMPVGVVMVWETKRSQRLHLRQKYSVLPDFNPKHGKVWFLIDGQQRVSVVHNVAEGKMRKNARGKEVDFRRVVYSLEPEEDGQQIRYRKPVQGRYEPLCDILHAQWASKLSHLGTRHKGRVRDCRNRLLKYPMQLMFVSSKLDLIRESFLRINTQGMKITSADAIFTQAEGLDLRDFRHEVEEHLKGGFERMSEMPILFTMAAIRGATEPRGRALRQIIQRIEEEAKDDKAVRTRLTKEWHRLKSCFGKAVDYLRDNFKVLNREFLYSDYIVSMLAYFYFLNGGSGPNPNQKEQIRKWFWATNVGSRYSGRNFDTCIPADLKSFKKLAERPSHKFTFRAETEVSEVRRAQYASNSGITAAFYCMLLRRGPVSIFDDGLNEIPMERYATTANRKDRHHIFPAAVMNALQVPARLYNSIANICLLTAEENQTISSRRPRSYMGDAWNHSTYFNKKLSRHLIPAGDDSGIWLSDAKKGFTRLLKQRTDLICDALEAEAGFELFRRDL